jgi:hypothetical protein
MERHAAAAGIGEQYFHAMIHQRFHKDISTSHYLSASGILGRSHVIMPPQRNGHSMNQEVLR